MKDLYVVRTVAVNAKVANTSNRTLINSNASNISIFIYLGPFYLFSTNIIEEISANAHEMRESL